MTPPALDVRLYAIFGQLAARGLPGAAVGLDAGDVRLRRAFGLADPSGAAPLSLGAPLRVGSVSKLVVGAVARTLIAEGLLHPDDPVSRFRPEAPGGDRITIEMLGRHRSGLRDALENPAFRQRINADPTAPIPLAAVLEAGFALPPRFAPGAGECYANVNAILLAEACAMAAGRPYGELARRLVLEPAGAGLFPAGPMPPDAPRGFRHGRGPGRIEYGAVFFDATAHDPSWAGPAGDLVGRLEDLLRLGRLLRRATPRPAEGTWSWLAQRLPGGLTGHAGDVPGYSAFLAWDPEAELVIAACATLSNFADGANPAETFALQAVKAHLAG